MSSAPLRALESFVRLNNTAAISHIVRASIETGVLESLRQQQQTLEEMAEASGISPERLVLILNSLRSIGIVEQYGEHYALAQVGHMVPVELADLGDRYWRHLNRWIVEGVSIPENDQSTLDESDFERERFANEWLQTPSALALAEKLGVGSDRTALDILDIDCGSAVFSLTLCYQDDQSRLVGYDSSFGIERAKQTVEGISAFDRVELITDEAEGRSYELPQGPFDLILFGNAAHSMPFERVSEVVEKAVKVLKPGGELILIDVFPGQPRGELTRSLYELQLALRYPQGQIHTREALEEVLAEKGLEVGEFISLEAPPWLYGAIVAKRPE